MWQAPQDQSVCMAIHASIEKRWAKTDQLPYIAALILNPHIKTSLFASTSQYALSSSAFILLATLWKHFFKDLPQYSLHDDLQE